MRLASIAITALLAIGVRDSAVWQSAVLSIGFGHYLLSIWYARAKLAKVATNRGTALPMAAAVLGGTLLYLVRFPLIIYFAVHHVFNEVYIAAENLKSLNVNQLRLYRTIAILLQTSLYFYLLRDEPGIRVVPVSILLTVLIVAYVCYVALLLSLRKSMSVRSLLELDVRRRRRPAALTGDGPGGSIGSITTITNRVALPGSRRSDAADSGLEHRAFAGGDDQLHAVDRDRRLTLEHVEAKVRGRPADARWRRSRRAGRCATPHNSTGTGASTPATRPAALALRAAAPQPGDRQP